MAVSREHVEAAENARKRKSDKEIEIESKIRKENDEKIELLEQEIRQLHASKEKDRKIIQDLQEKFSSLQQAHESMKASAARLVLQQGETSRTQTEKCEDKMDDHGERITDLERHQQIADGRVDQHEERLDIIEQRVANQDERADNQDRRIDDLQPPAGKIFLTIVNHVQV